MNANKWYSIAQTTVFDTSCGINITFGDSSSVLFTASVKYGVSSLNISSCSIEESYNISVRLRETESKWCVDLLSNIEINPIIDITDSPYWIADNSLAGNGAVIAIIENISKEFNTTGGGGSGEGGESLFDRINIGTDANPQYAVVPKDFNGSYVHIVSRGDVLAGGEGTPGEPGQGATTLGGLNNVDAGADEIYNTDKVLVKPSLGSHWKAFDLSSIVGLDVDALKAYLNANEYATITDINNSVAPIAIKVDGYNDRILALESLGLTIKEENGKKYLQSEYDFIGLGDIVAGGGNIEEDENKDSTLGSLYNVDKSADEIFNTAKVLLKPINDSHWRAFDVSSIVGLDTNALKQYLDTNKYITETALEGYATTDDVTELSNSVSNLRTDFDNLNNLLNDDTSGVIDTWNEVVDFLNGYKESEDLATILSKMNEDIAERVLQTSFDTHISTYNTFITSDYTPFKTETQKLLDVFGIDEDGNVYVKKDGDKPRSFYAYGDITSGGIGEEGPTSGGIIQQVYGASAFGGTFDSNNLTDTFNAHAINSLYTTIQRGVKNPYALTINGTSYDGSSAVDITISGGGGVADSINWANVYNKPTTLGGYGITDALSTSGGTIESTDTYGLAINAGADASGIQLQSNGTLKGILISGGTWGAAILNGNTFNGIGVLDDGTPYFKDVYSTGNTYTLIHSGNIGSYNAGSATKLQTARSIWGQSFDGTGDVSGIFRSNPNSHGLTVEGLGDPWYGTKTYLTWDQAQTMGVCRVGTSYQYQGLSIGFSLGNAYNYGRVENFSYTDVLLIKPNGNVLMGSTYDYGYKLNVNGGIGSKDRIGVLADAGYYHFSPDGATLYTYIGHDKPNAYTWLYNGISGGAVVLYDAGGINLTQSTTIMGNLVATGDVTAGSDARYKSKLQDIAIDVATIANAPVFSYKWNDREDNNVHLGTTAQYWMDTNFKDAVNTNNPDFYHLNYGALGVAIGVSVAKKVVNHEERLKIAEARIEELENELKQYRRA